MTDDGRDQVEGDPEDREDVGAVDDAGTPPERRSTRLFGDSGNRLFGRSSTRLNL